MSVCDHEEPCGCYAEGYAQGKAKTYFEVRAVLDAGDHAAGCGCEPCKLLRDVGQVQELRRRRRGRILG